LFGEFKVIHSGAEFTTARGVCQMGMGSWRLEIGNW
jgi:hypothetical protein